MGLRFSCCDAAGGVVGFENFVLELERARLDILPWHLYSSMMTQCAFKYQGADTAVCGRMLSRMGTLNLTVACIYAQGSSSLYILPHIGTPCGLFGGTRHGPLRTRCRRGASYAARESRSLVQALGPALACAPRTSARHLLCWLYSSMRTRYMYSIMRTRI